MKFASEPPLMIQRDLTVWLATDHPEFEEMRDMLAQFAELIKSPPHLHMYRITSLSLWNAAAAGLEPDMIGRFLHANSRMGLPQTVRADIKRTMGRYGMLLLEAHDGKLYLKAKENGLLDELLKYPFMKHYTLEQRDPCSVEVRLAERGRLKQELIRLGYPVEDIAGYQLGEALDVRLRSRLPNGAPFVLREYQAAAVDAFYRQGKHDGGSGVLVLPCGAGKTIIGIEAMSRFRCETLILTTNVTSVRQWKREILEKTELSPELVGEYSGGCKEVRPVTIATYQILTHRKSKDEGFAHMELFNKRDWGLIVYDEVHLLPAPVFRATADIQARRRLGLTATLVREDGCEADVFSLIGPKRYDAPWKRLEDDGWLARVRCTEIRVPLDRKVRERYAASAVRDKARVAGENPLKLPVVERLLDKFGDEPVLIIGHYLSQLRSVAEKIKAPLLTGEIPQEERERLYAGFRDGILKRLVVSKVANFAVDLPDAAVAVQISGSFGSRQEEAQRLGRILRPKSGANEAHFYTLVSRDTKEQEFAMNRQLFLVEQGYEYRLSDAEELLEGEVL